MPHWRLTQGKGLTISATLSNSRRTKALPALAATALLVVIGLPVVVHQRLCRQAEARLAALGAGQGRQVEEWRARCLADAAVLSENELLAQAAEAYLDSPTPERGDAMLSRFTSLRQHYGYADIVLVDRHLTPRLSIHDDDPPLDECLRPAMAASLRTREPRITDLHRDQLSDVPHIGLVAPLTGPLSRKRPVRAALILVVQTPRRLYPLLDAWPTLAQSGQTILARRDGKQVLLLNDPRGRADVALALGYPLTRTELPVVKAALDGRGLLHGRDEQGARVVAFAAQIADSEWRLVAQVRAAELYGAARWQSLLLLGVLLVLAVGRWHRRQRRHFEALYRAETQAGDEGRMLRTLLGNLPGMAYRCANDPRWTMTFLSDGCQALTGYRPEDLAGSEPPTYADVIHPEDRQAVWDQVQAAVADRAAFEITYRIVRRDGQTRWVWERGCGVFDGDQLVSLEGFIADITDRTEAEAGREEAVRALIAKSGELDRYFDSALDLLCITDTDGRLIRLNPEWEAVLGYPVTELQGRMIVDLVHPEDRAATVAALAQLQSQESVFALENRLRRADGAYRWIEWRSRPTGGRVYSAARDITARKAAEAALRESEDRIQSVLRVAPVGIGVAVDRAFRQVNRRMCEVTGYTEAELIGQNARLLYTSDQEYEDIGREEYAQIHDHGTGTVETCWRRKDGETIKVLLSSTPIDMDDLSKGVTFTALDITDRARAEDALREAERQYRILVDNSQSIIYTITPNGELTFVSPSWTTVLGHEPDEVTGRDCRSLIHPDDQEACKRLLRQTAESGAALAGVEYRAFHKDGSVRWHRSVVTPVFDDQGALALFVGNAVDITERRDAEAQVLLLSTALDHIDEGAFLTTEEGRFAYVNGGACRALGYTREELLGMTVADIDPDFPVDRWPDHWASLGEGEATVFETTHRSKSGKLTPVEISAKVIAFQGQHYSMALARDITERRLAQQALAASEAHYRGILERVDLIAVELDATGRVLFANDYLVSLSGWTRDEIVGQDWFEQFLPVEQRSQVGRVFRDTISQHDPHIHYDNAIVTRDGRERWVHWSNTTHRDEAGQVLSMVCLGEDVTELRLAQEAINHRLLTLTAPGEAADIAFEDLFDLDELQIVQDSFAAATGVASIITHIDGTPLTRPSNFCRLCNDVIRGTERGRANCFCSDAVIGRHNPDGPVVQRCLSGGLWDGGASITVGGRHVANWLIGQIKNDHLDEQAMLAYAREIGADETEFAQALAEVNVMSVEQFQRVADALFVVASELSQSAYQNVLQAREISSRRRAEAALAESERRLEAAQAMAHIGHWELASGGEVLVWSDEVYRIFGVGQGDFDGSLAGFSAMVHPEDVAAVLDSYQQSIDDNQPGYEIEHRIIRRNDGEVRWVHEKCVHDRDADGQLVRSLGMVQDITDRKAAETERLRLQDQLAQAQKMESVGRLAGGVAHDFNNMLGVILGHVELALEEVTPSHPLHGDLREVQAAAQRSADLTRQLLAFARRQTVMPRLLDLNTTVTDSLKMLRRLIGEDVTLTWTPGSGLWPVRMDPTQVDQMLANLCVNARDAIRGVGRITIGTENWLVGPTQVPPAEGMTAGEWVRLSVSDTGCGMDETTAAQVFEPFFTTKEVGQGTGLGLATVYGVVRQNEGFITVESAPGQGTTFHIYLPRCELEPSALAAPHVETPLGSGQTVLLVEDEPAILRMAQRLLEGLGYRVVTADGPPSALAAAVDRQLHIDLLMTDVVMPEMNGRDLAEQLRALQPDLRCLFMSGYTADVIAHQGVLDPGMHFIQKPFTRRDLASAVQGAMQG